MDEYRVTDIYRNGVAPRTILARNGSAAAEEFARARHAESGGSEREWALSLCRMENGGPVPGYEDGYKVSHVRRNADGSSAFVVTHFCCGCGRPF